MNEAITNGLAFILMLGKSQRLTFASLLSKFRVQLFKGRKPTVPLFILLFLCLLGEQYFSKRGVDQLQETGDITAYLIIGLGYSFLIFRGMIWLLIVRVVSLSVAYPIQTLSFVLILIMSHYAFNEELSMTKIAGSALIMVGVGITSIRK